MPNKAQEDAVINLQSLRDLGKQLSFEWPMVAYELGFTRAEISQIHALTPEKKSQAQKMLEHWNVSPLLISTTTGLQRDLAGKSSGLISLLSMPALASGMENGLLKYSRCGKLDLTKEISSRREYERSWEKPNKTKLLQEALEKSGRQDLAEKLRCLHWGHQKLSNKVELPSAFPFLITVYKTTNNKERLKKINQLTHK